MKSDYALTYKNLALREELLGDLQGNGFNPVIFRSWWEIIMDMTLANIKSNDEIISYEFYLQLISHQVDFQDLIFSAFYDRATFLSKFTDEIIEHPEVWDDIFTPTIRARCTRASVNVMLKKLGYLDSVFCKQNGHLADISPDMINGIQYLYRFYADELDYFSSTEDKNELERIEELNGHMIYFRTDKMHFDISKYYTPLDSSIYTELFKN